MGTGYKGNSSDYRSVGQNLLQTSSSFDYANGYFGDNSPHGSISTRNIRAHDNLAAAQKFFDFISYGGIINQRTSNMEVVRMADGTIITMRKVSHSDGTPVVDVNIRRSTHSGGIKNQKIHFIMEGDGQ